MSNSIFQYSKLRRVKYDYFRVDGQLLTPSHVNYKEALAEWRRRFKESQHTRSERYRAKIKPMPIKPVEMKPKRASPIKVKYVKPEPAEPTPIQTRVTVEGIKVYDADRRMWVVFRSADKVESFFKKLNATDVLGSHFRTIYDRIRLNEGGGF